MSLASGDKKLKIAFIHPDLGIGGAERLVVDAAVGLQEQGHEVVIYTSHCDKTHCFEEIKNGVLSVEVFGDHLPTNFCGKFYILFANLRQLYLVLRLVVQGKLDKHNIYIVDQLSTCLPFLHVLSSAKLLFYCHFPDQLLAIRSSLIKKLYRIPFDLFEQFTMGAADSVAVNSQFTKSVYHKTFSNLTGSPKVIYPCVDLASPKIDDLDNDLLNHLLPEHQRYYLSINRYERKKNISLALQAYALSDEVRQSDSKLIICGGYDDRVPENVDYLKELQGEAERLKLSYATFYYPEFQKSKDFDQIKTTDKKIIFLTSISSSLKELLLRNMELLLYTPSFEHFGIVPLEAMKHGKPVIASNTGGPLETIETLIKGQNEAVATGWLKDSKAGEWAEAINDFVAVKQKHSVNFEHNGPERVKRYFSRLAMTRSLEENIDTFIERDKPQYGWEVILQTLATFLTQFGIMHIFERKHWIWPYSFMALLSIFYFKTWRFGFYWSAVVAATIIQLWSTELTA